MGWLQRLKPQKNEVAPLDTNVKNRILKNGEAVLDVMGRNIKGARQCPLLGGQKCIGEFCEHFMELSSVNAETKETTTFWRCAHVETPLLLIELNNNIRNLMGQLNASNDTEKR
ncbi:MAG: hypothetical protein DRJ03_03530 [Chloroflexi bacterium]|nr:MAG: hypothetical protein DRJ03_03530 [Chloroflexota bacterium]